MPQHDLPAADGLSARTHQAAAAVSTRTRSLTKLARASAGGALALAAAQMVDMRVTGRQGSDTPVRAFEALTRHRVRNDAEGTAVGYFVQSSLAPLGAVAALLAGERVTRRFGAAFLAPLVFVGIVGPAVGASAWPWHWTRNDWTRELTLKSVLAIAIIAGL
jgi:hypothetical protein